MNKQTLSIAALLMLAMIGAGCQSGYESKAMGTPTADAPAGDQGNNGQDVKAPTPDWSGVSQVLAGKVDSGNYEGKLTVYVDQPGQALILRLPTSTALLLPLFGEFPIASLPGATLTHNLDAAGDRQLLLKMPFKYIVRDGNLAVYNRLPNGNPLPYMPEAEGAHGFAIDLPQQKNYKLHLYFTASAVGAFIEIPEIPEMPYAPYYLGAPIKNESKTQVLGFLAIYGRKGTNSAGVFVASKVPDSVAILIDEMIRY